MSAAEKSIYSHLSVNQKTLYIYYGEPQGNVISTGSPAGDLSLEQRQAITKVVFDSSVAEARPESTKDWFSFFSSLTTIDNLDYLNTEEVTDMEGMFGGCSALTSLDLSGFSTANVTTMREMFGACEALTSLDVRNFNTSNVTDMRWMFGECKSLVNIYCKSDWNTAQLSTSEGMFSNCEKLVGGNGTEYDSGHTDASYAHPDEAGNPGYFTNKNIYSVLSSDGKTLTVYYGENPNGGADGSPAAGLTINQLMELTTVIFDVSVKEARPISTKAWFGYFMNMTSIEHLDYLNTSNVTDMSYMFSSCRSLSSIDLSGFNTDNVTDMSYMFSSCSSLNSLDVSGFNISSVTDMSYMFEGCSSLTTIYCNEDWDSGKGFNMFNGCENLVGGKGTPYDFEYTDDSYAHPDQANNPGYFTKNDIYSMLSSDGKTLTIYYGANQQDVDADYPTANLTDAQREVITTVVFDKSVKEARPQSTAQWFSNFHNLTSIEHLDYLNTEEVTDMYSMFNSCSSLTSLDLSSFDTYNVTDMSSMFGNCSSLTSLDLSSFDTYNVTDMSYMFGGCSSLASLDVSNLNTTNVTNMSSMFSDCTSLVELDLSNFYTIQVTDMSYMFFGDGALTTIYCKGNWNTAQLEFSQGMFLLCNKLVGGNGTKYSSSHTDASYAHPDEEGNPGYFTAEGHATSLETLNAEEGNYKPVKVIDPLTHRVYILMPDGRKYDASGRRLK